MPCYSPLQAISCGLLPNGKKDIRFFSDDFFRPRLTRRVDVDGSMVPIGDRLLLLPCGKCIGCRLELSRQWAVRCVHEAKMHEENSFVTLTFSPDGLAEMCPRGSLDVRHVQLFMKKLRFKFSGKQIRVFYCGEYGAKYFRPHYHLCLFGHRFADSKVFRRSALGHTYYQSDDLSDLWPYGMAVYGELTFESAAYVARYCLKKMGGDRYASHYRRLDPVSGEEYFLTPEFSRASNRPGIGAGWFDRYAETDLIPHDSCVVRGRECKIPRYYEKLWERKFPESYFQAKELRRFKALARSNDDFSWERLQVRMKCQTVRLSKLVRKMEDSLCC